MRRVGIVFALLALLCAVANSQSEVNSTSTAGLPSTTTVQSISTSDAPMSGGDNKTKEGVGEGRGHHRRGGYRRRYDDDSDESYEGGYDFHSYSRVKPYFDTHYCSVHGSFRLAYNEKKEYNEKDGYQQPGYGNQGNDYGNQGGGYGQSDNSGYGYKKISYQKPDGDYGKKSYKEKPNYVRKITRQYCRYAAAWSEKACKFCCKVVARSAYTNPDDVIAAIFSFDPANPSSGGYGVESYGGDKDKYGSEDYGKQDYGKQDYGKPEYGNQGGYQSQNNYAGDQGYGNQGGYENGNSYGGNQQSYPQANYGNGPYRAKRNSNYSPAPAPAYGSQPAPSYGGTNEQYSQSEQYQQPEGQYSATSNAYATKPDYGNKYENNPNAIKQCVCCAPKQRYY